MKRILSILTLLIGGLAFADVPNTFQAGEAIKASEMNENFTAIDSDVTAVSNDSATHEAAIDELESKVSTLEGQVEALQSIVSSVSEAASTDIEFAGLSDPAVFGAIGYKAGQSVCQAKYDGSRICTGLELQQVTDWSNFTLDAGLFIAHYRAGLADNNPNVCNNFSDRSAKFIDVGIVESNETVFFESSSGSDGLWFYDYSYPAVFSWIINNFPQHESAEVSKVSSVNAHHLHPSGAGVKVSPCNIAIPAACCK